MDVGFIGNTLREHDRLKQRAIDEMRNRCIEVANVKHTLFGEEVLTAERIVFGWHEMSSAERVDAFMAILSTQREGLDISQFTAVMTEVFLVPPEDLELLYKEILHGDNSATGNIEERDNLLFAKLTFRH